jgi:hypothetical protein
VSLGECPSQAVQTTAPAYRISGSSPLLDGYDEPDGVFGRAELNKTWSAIQTHWPLSQWLFDGLAKADLPVMCIETGHTKAFLKAQVNKTDKSDARGMAQMMRVTCSGPCMLKP